MEALTTLKNDLDKILLERDLSCHRSLAIGIASRVDVDSVDSVASRVVLSADQLVVLSPLLLTILDDFGLDHFMFGHGAGGVLAGLCSLALASDSLLSIHRVDLVQPWRGIGSKIIDEIL